MRLEDFNIKKDILLDIGNLKSIKGVVIHNDGGYMRASEYHDWLKNKSTKQLEKGVAHYYVDYSEIWQFIENHRIGWHTASTFGNLNYIGIEVCESFGDEAHFLKNEYRALELAEYILSMYDLEINEETVKLHREFSSTDCPHRSVEIHKDAKRYFIETMKKIRAKRLKKGEVLDDMQKLNERKLVLNEGYSVDSLPWDYNAHKKLGAVDEHIGQVVTCQYEHDGYYYSQFLGGWVDVRAFKDVETVHEEITIKNKGYSVDSLPWTMRDNKRYKKYDATDNLLNKKVTVTAKLGSYWYVENHGWIDYRAF